MGAIFHHMLFGYHEGENVSSKSRKLSFRLQKLIDKMLAIDPINRPTSAQQVLVELQRIAKSGNEKSKRSNIAKKNSGVKKNKKNKSKVKNNQQNKDQSKVLSIALGISLLLIVLLVVKDFF
jgi:serine/threonine protein kinase